MTYTDTRDSSLRISFKDAVMRGMNARTGGLFVPCEIPKLPSSFLQKIPEPSFRDIAFESAKLYCSDDIPERDLQSIIVDAYPFSPQIVPADKNSYILELFHGPTCAFKDFGARFMARVMSYFNQHEKDPLHILVATSGDTGSAVGSAFQGLAGIDVTILYPEGKISLLQEKQLATFSGNVRALRVAGNFDDCQRLVKQAFTDADLRKKLRLSSANSINIARLLPQSFYYIFSSLVVKNRSLHDTGIESPAILVSVPSGNFGNLTSGLIAREMGAPISGFIAATNANRTIPDWISDGTYRPRASIPTLSNAMDVGSPSNYERIASMYTLEQVRRLLAAFWLDDAGILAGMDHCHSRTGYIMDPHGAIAWKAWNDIKSKELKNICGGGGKKEGDTGLVPSIPDWAPAVLDGKAVCIVLETAHPSKFGETVRRATGRETVLPDRLEKVLRLPDRAIPMSSDYAVFKDWLNSELIGRGRA